MFVEVKSPGWESEIANVEGQDSPRLQQPKYINAEARITGPWLSVRNSVKMAYPKMPNSIPTLLMIADDLTVPLSNWLLNVEIALYSADGGCFAGSKYQRLGAV